MEGVRVLSVVMILNNILLCGFVNERSVLGG